MSRTTTRLTHHGAIALLSGLAAWIVDIVIRADTMPLSQRASLQTGYVGLGLLAWTLLMGPYRVFRGKACPAHLDLRRDVGWWAAGLGTVHVLLGFQQHFAGDWLRYFFARRPLLPQNLHFNLFGLANQLGLLAGLLLLLLLVISTDGWMRRLGTQRWKRWQQSAYVAAAATVAHTFSYQSVENRSLSWVVLVVALTLAILAAQGAGFARRRRSG